MKYLRRITEDMGLAKCRGPCVAELVFLRNRVTPEPILITRTAKNTARAPSLSPVTTSIKSGCEWAASYAAIDAR